MLPPTPNDGHRGLTGGAPAWSGTHLVGLGGVLLLLWGATRVSVGEAGRGGLFGVPAPPPGSADNKLVSSEPGRPPVGRGAAVAVESAADGPALLSDALPGTGDLSESRESLEVLGYWVAVHDVGILRVEVDATSARPGANLALRVVLVNHGSQPEQDVAVDFLIGARTPLEPTRPVILAPGETSAVLYEWTVPPYVPGPNELLPAYLLTFSVAPVPGEERTADNISHLRLIVNRQGRVDITRHEMLPGKEVHQWIANEGYDYFATRMEGADIASYLGTIAGSQGDDRNTFLEGTAAEDKGDRPPLFQWCPFEGYPTCPYYRHFCAGADGAEIYDGLAAYDANLTQAENIWDDALAAYPGNKDLAFYYLGHVAHLLADLTVPAHTHNDEHPIWDGYEDNIEAYHNYELWYYGGGRSGDWTQDLTLFADLYSLFYRTANYTEDYDSDDEDGDGPPYYQPSDYVPTWHHPELVDNAGAEIDINEVAIIGDDLMPYAMKRSAELICLFYSLVDTSDPTCTMTYPVSIDVNNPDYRTSMTAFNLTATGSDPQSGVEVASYHFHYAYWTGTSWTDWTDIAPSPTVSSVSFTPPYGNTLYAFYVYLWNGGGRAGVSEVKYVLVDTSNPTAPTISGYSDSGHGTALTSGGQYSYPNPHFHFSASDNGSGISGYYLYWGTSSTADPATWNTSADYTAAGLGYGTTCYLRVKARDRAGRVGPVSTFTYVYVAPAPTGACCRTDGSCTEDLSEVTCENTLGGTWRGADSVCPLTWNAAAAACFTGPVAGVNAGCVSWDLNANGHVDLRDFAAHQRDICVP